MSKLLTGLPMMRLTRAEEKILLEQNDLNTLIEHNLREAFCYGKGTFQGRSLSDGNILSAAYEGLASAAKNFDPDHGLRFFAYAKPYVRGSLCKVHRNEDKMHQAGVLKEDTEDPDEENENNYVSPRTGASPWCKVPDYEGIFVKEEWSRVKPVLEQVLDARERMIIELNFLGGLNLREIADLMGVSRACVHHSRKEAFEKIRNHLMETNKFSREA